MDFQSHCDIVRNAKKIVYVDDVIEATRDEESTIGGESGTADVIGVPIFVFFY